MSERIRVLVVEDSEDDALLVLHELRQGGLEPEATCVATREAMNEALDQQTWDVVIADYFMPRFSAPAALKLLKERSLDIPFIIVSGKVGQDAAVAAMRAGAHDYLLKSDLARLAPAIEREMRDAQMRQARRNAEEALRDSELRYRSLFEQSNDAIFIHDPEGRILDANERASELVGLSKDHLQRSSIQDLCPDEDREYWDRALPQTTRADAGARFETWLRNADGGAVEVEVSSRTTAQENGAIQAVVRDITARREAEANQRFSIVGELASGIVHDFNNILTVMTSKAQHADLVRTEAAYRATIDAVLEGAMRAAQVCHDLTDLAGPRAPERRPLLIETVIDSALSMAECEIAHTGALVKCVYRADGHQVNGDAGQLQQVFLNLIINACHAMPDGGTLTITTDHAAQVGTSGEVCVRVSDTGCGIASENLPMIFDSFFTTKAHGDDAGPRGTGMGLSVSRSIIAAHDGSIEAQSELGVGTTFELRLQACAESAGRSEGLDVGAPETRAEHGDGKWVLLVDDDDVQMNATAPRLNAKASESGDAGAPETRAEHRDGKWILLVDDDDIQMNATAQLLSGCGYHVMEAPDAMEGLKAMQQHEPDVIVSDLMVPGGGARELLAALKGRSHQPPMIVMTGLANDEIFRELLELGATACLRKPFDLRDLGEAIDRALDAGPGSAGATHDIAEFQLCQTG